VPVVTNNPPHQDGKNPTGEIINQQHRFTSTITSQDRRNKQLRGCEGLWAFTISFSN
jgi:hypothetical protein